MNKLRIIISDNAAMFIRKQPLKVQEKIAYNIKKVESGIIDDNLFKKLGKSEIWELRTLFFGACYRLFAFWDADVGALVVVTHGIVKKTNKTPIKEIVKAEKLKLEYYKQKR